MKLSTCILLLMIGALVFYVVKYPEALQPGHAPQPAVEARPAPMVYRTQPVRIYRDQLVPLAGRIVAIEQGALTIDCPAPALPPPPNFSGPGWQLDAMAGRTASKNLAKLAADQEAKYRAAVKEAEKKVSGVVVLAGHPQQSALRAGMPVNVLAAPLGARSFTMAYEIAPDPPGAWMQKSGTALDRR